EQMRAPELARLAGEAFTMITGADLVSEKLEAERPAGFEVGPTEDPEHPDVEVDPQEHLPWPEPEAIGAWWKDHAADFPGGSRYLLGKPVSRAWLRSVLRTGGQRQRAAAALELAVQEPGEPL